MKKIVLALALALSITQISAANDLYNTPIGELEKFKDIDTTELEALFSDAFAENELAAAIKEHAPDVYDDLLNAMLVSFSYDQTIMEVTTDMIPIIKDKLMDYLPYADDKSLLMFSQSMQPLMEVVENHPDDCQALLMGDSRVMAKLALNADASLHDEMNDMYVRVLQTYDKKRKTPIKDDIMPELMTTMMPVIDAYGAEILIALEHPALVNNSMPCLSMRALYDNISQLPEHDAAELLRFIVSLAR